MAQERADGAEALQPTKLQRTDKDAKITMGFAVKPAKDAAARDSSSSSSARVFNVFAADDSSGTMRAKTGNDDDSSKKRKRASAVDDLMAEEERRKRAAAKKQQQQEDEAKRLDHWLTRGIVVKVVNKKVGGGAYYKQKGVVTAVEDKFCATVELLQSGDVLRLDQDDLETVIPKVGRSVKVVNGVGRGSVAELLAISVDDFCASIRFTSGSRKCVSLFVIWNL